MDLDKIQMQINELVAFKRRAEPLLQQLEELLRPTPPIEPEPEQKIVKKGQQQRNLGIKRSSAEPQLQQGDPG